MKNFCKKIAVLAFTGVMVFSANAQEEKQGVEFNVSGDFVSSYVWRGMYQGGYACIQPTLGASYRGLSLSAWGSTSLAGSDGSNEVDLYLTYEFKNFMIQLSDLWWDGQVDDNYFHYNNHATGHHFEAGIGYTLPLEKFPLSMTWYTMFAGNDKKDISDENPYGKQAYSSYAELNFPFSVKSVDLEATLGFVPYASQSTLGYDVNGFAVTNVALKATKEIRITNSFSLPLFAQLVANPAHEDLRFVVGFTIQ